MLNKTLLGKEEVAMKTKMQLYYSVLIPTLTYSIESLQFKNKI